MKPAGGTEITCFNIYYNTKGVIKYFLDTVTNEAVLLHFVGTIVGVGISVVGYLIFDEWRLRNSIKDCVQ